MRTIRRHARDRSPGRVLIVVTYYVAGAAVAAWLSTGTAVLDWKLSILILPVMYLAHLGHKKLAGNQDTASVSPKNCACLQCRNQIGAFRRLARHRFCCDEHERTYLAELEELAIERLRNARIHALQQDQGSPEDAILRIVPSSEHRVCRQAPPAGAGHEQSLSLMVRPEANGFPAYRAAMS